ncbi:hypothetical protein DSO57_1008810 [Entomophthora muscae]|uniref:Uncharacterized protein n=1 Tax=Entomophthora muscae TaxID=34485 RepID=A0ACC2UTB1_9FUNG|nr:hypothetical protein DSO57_1008810 [Entomophthora muscae]
MKLFGLIAAHLAFISADQLNRSSPSFTAIPDGPKPGSAALVGIINQETPVSHRIDDENDILNQPTKQEFVFGMGMSPNRTLTRNPNHTSASEAILPSLCLLFITVSSGL